MRTYIELEPAMFGKFKALGGSAWLAQTLAQMPEPDERPARAVPMSEREQIAGATESAKLVARRHRTTVDFVYYVRKRLKS